MTKRTRLVRCRRCRCWIDLEYGKEPPAAHIGASGTQDDPRSPGDHDDLCDVCDYTRLQGRG